MEFSIGGSVRARDGKDATILAHGEMVGEALDAAEELAAEGIDVRVVDMYTIKPFDRQAVQSAVDETDNIIVWEDHLMMGGLASSIADFFVDNGIQPRKFRRFGIPQVYAGFGSGEALRQKYGYAKEDVMKAIREMV